MSNNNLIKGIDISSVQGNNIDFNAIVSSGIKFCIIKCGNGNDGIDPYYKTNLTNAQKAGLKVACYHVVYPLPTSANHPDRDPISQAQMHFNASEGQIACIDWEWPEPQDWNKWDCNADQMNEWLLAYLQEYEKLSGKKPIIYTYPDFANHLNMPIEFTQYQLWIASYETTTPLIPKPWTEWIMWQDSDGGGKLPSGAPVDTDVIRDLSLWDPVPAQAISNVNVVVDKSMPISTPSVLATSQGFSLGDVIIWLWNFVINLFKNF